MANSNPSATLGLIYEGRPISFKNGISISDKKSLNLFSWTGEMGAWFFEHVQENTFKPTYAIYPQPAICHLVAWANGYKAFSETEKSLIKSSIEEILTLTNIGKNKTEKYKFLEYSHEPIAIGEYSREEIIECTQNYINLIDVIKKVSEKLELLHSLFKKHGVDTSTIIHRHKYSDKVTRDYTIEFALTQKFINQALVLSKLCENKNSLKPYIVNAKEYNMKMALDKILNPVKNYFYLVGAIPLSSQGIVASFKSQPIYFVANLNTSRYLQVGSALEADKFESVEKLNKSIEHYTGLDRLNLENYALVEIKDNELINISLMNSQSNNEDLINFVNHSKAQMEHINLSSEITTPLLIDKSRTAKL